MDDLFVTVPTALAARVGGVKLPTVLGWLPFLQDLGVVASEVGIGTRARNPLQLLDELLPLHSDRVWIRDQLVALREAPVGREARARLPSSVTKSASDSSSDAASGDEVGVALPGPAASGPDHLDQVAAALGQLLPAVASVRYPEVDELSATAEDLIRAAERSVRRLASLTRKVQRPLEPDFIGWSQADDHRLSLFLGDRD